MKNNNDSFIFFHPEREKINSKLALHKIDREQANALLKLLQAKLNES